MNMSLLSTIATLCSAVEFSHERLQNAVLKIVHDELVLHFKPKAKIEDMRHIYEADGKIPAIKEWRSTNTDRDGQPMGLKDAKDQIEAAASNFGWKDHKIGKQCTINCPDSDWDLKVGMIEQVINNGGGYYVKFAECHHSIFFHQSAVVINR